MRKFNKAAVLAIVLCLALLMSGCGIQREDLAVTNAQVIVDVNGRTVDRQTALNAINNEVTERNNEVYSQYGYSNIYSADMVQDEVLDALARDLVEENKMQELGIVLTEEEEAAAEAKGKEEYEYDISTLYMYAMMYGYDDINAFIRDYVGYEITEEGYIDINKESALHAKLQSEVTKDVTVDAEADQEAILAKYDALLAADQASYAAAAAYASAYNNGTSSLYAPEGLRYVKQILIRFTEEDQAIISEKQTARSEAQSALTTAQNALTAAVNALVTDEQAAVTEAKTALNDAQSAFDTKLAEITAGYQTSLEAAEAKLAEATAAMETLTEEADKAATQAQIDELNGEIGMYNIAIDNAANEEDIKEEKAALDAAQAACDAAQKVLDDAKAAAETPDEQAEVDAKQAALDAADAELKAAIDTAYANIQAKTDEVMAKIAAGEDFDTLMETYNEDPGMQSEPFKTTGYVISTDYTDFDSVFVDAGMALANPGDTAAEPARGEAYGYYILHYVGDVKSGDVTLEDAMDTVKAAVLAEKQAAYYEEQVDQWVKDANIKLYPDRLYN